MLPASQTERPEKLRNFYGTTPGGGAHSAGTVFKVTTNGTLTTLFSFSTSPGSSPQTYPGGPTQASDGNFYGTTLFGHGTMFRMIPAGVLTNLFSFDSYYYGIPDCPIQASDGNFYGLTGGGTGGGIVYKMTPEGSWTILVSFNGTDVAVPLSALVQGTDENFYGTSIYGGDLSFYGGPYYVGGGTVFRIVMPPPPPTPTIAQDGNQMVLSWPTSATGFALQLTTNLTPPIVWSDSTDASAVVGTQFTVTNANSAPCSFFA
jgi:uncharacterized repeat protein (TIGR03803 family)